MGLFRVRVEPDCKVTTPPLPPVLPPDVVIDPTVIPPCVAVRVTAPPALVPVPAVFVAPAMEIEPWVAVTLRAKLPVMLELNEREEEPVCIRVVAPVRTTGPVKVAEVPLVVLLVPLKEIEEAVMVKEPVEIGPNVKFDPVHVPPAVKLCDPMPLETLKPDPNVMPPDVA